MTQIIERMTEKFEECSVMSRLGKLDSFITLVDDHGNLTSFGFVDSHPVPYRLMLSYVLAYSHHGRTDDEPESLEDLLMFWDRIGFSPRADYPTTSDNPIRRFLVDRYKEICSDPDEKRFREKYYEFFGDLERGLETSLETPIHVPENLLV